MKNINKKMVVITTLIGILYIVSCTLNKKEDTKDGTAKSLTSNKYSSDAINNPHKFAWDVFIEINKPSDPNKQDGETVWQKEWANVIDVFADSSKPADWSKIVGLPLLKDKIKGQLLQQKIFNEMLLKMRLTKMEIQSLHKTNICEVNQKYMDDSTLGETKMNKATFDFIIRDSMFNAEGVEAMFANNKKIDAPIEAREIKAIWKRIKASDKSKYHYVEKGALIYGLVSLHIITKDLPNWTWATFEHKNNECLGEAEKNPLLESKDKYGKNFDGTISKELKGDFIKNGMPDKWNNYILRGTQTDFITSTGENIILANTYTENGFVTTSSCITCHSRATVGPYSGKSTINQLDFFVTQMPKPIGHLGRPNPRWFYDYNADGSKTTKFIQTDFIWSIPLRVKRKAK